MTHTYNVKGMTCSSCVAKVKSELLKLADVESAEVSKENNEAVISMNQHIPLSVLQKAIALAGNKYEITEKGNHAHEMSSSGEQLNWFVTYKPILLIFFYITTITLLIQFNNGHFELMQWTQHFMAGFFLVFSFFKLLNLKGFAESYVMYDVLAKRVPAWAYAYAFIELSLGFAYAVNFNPIVTNFATMVVMSVSIIGVLQTVLNKKKIQCACLGAVFNLPMSTVTIIEDALMIAMSAAMIFIML